MAISSTQPGAQALETSDRVDSFFTTRRTSHYLTAALTGSLGLLLCLAGVALRNLPGMVLGLAGALLLYGAWTLVRHARDRRPVLQISSHGLTTRALPFGLAWHLIDDLAQVQRRGRVLMALTLREGTTLPGAAGRLFQRSGPALLQVDLSLLDASDRAMAFDAVHWHVAQARTAAGLGMTPSVRRAREVEQFAEELEALAPDTLALYGVVLINVLVWLVTVSRGLDVLRPDTEALFRWGANSAWAVTQDGEYRRLLASTLLHSGVSHLLSNLLGLWVAGRFVNRLYGNAQFLLIYIGSALAGSVASLHVSAQSQVSVGASGAVFGVLGAFLVAMFHYRDRLPARMGRNLLLSQFLFVSYSLLAGFFSKQGIDNAAHIGGLVGGALMAWLLVEKPGESPSIQRRTLRALGASAVMAVLLVLGIRHTPLPPVNHREVFATRDAMAVLQPQLEAVWRAWEQDNQALHLGKLTPADYIQALEGRHMPAFEAMEQTLAVHARARTGARETLADVRQLVGKTRNVMGLQIQRYRFPADAAVTDSLLASRIDELRQIGQRIAQRKSDQEARQRAARDGRPSGR